MNPITTLPELFKRLLQAFVLSLRKVRDILIPNQEQDSSKDDEENQIDKNT